MPGMKQSPYAGGFMRWKGAALLTSGVVGRSLCSVALWTSCCVVPAYRYRCGHRYGLYQRELLRLSVTLVVSKRARLRQRGLERGQTLRARGGARDARYPYSWDTFACLDHAYAYR